MPPEPSSYIPRPKRSVMRRTPLHRASVISCSSVVPFHFQITPQESLVYRFRPHRLEVVSLGGQLLHMAAVREHRVKLCQAAALGRKHQVYAIRPPPGILVASRAVGELDGHAPGDVHHKNVVIPRLVAFGPREGDELAVRAPLGFRAVTAAGRYTPHFDAPI